jgi:hypothetical protein
VYIRHDLALSGYPQSLVITAINKRKKECRPDINGTHLGTVLIIYVKGMSDKFRPTANVVFKTKQHILHMSELPY